MRKWFILLTTCFTLNLFCSASEKIMQSDEYEQLELLRIKLRLEIYKLFNPFLQRQRIGSESSYFSSIFSALGYSNYSSIQKLSRNSLIDSIYGLKTEDIINNAILECKNYLSSLETNFSEYELFQLYPFILYPFGTKTFGDVSNSSPINFEWNPYIVSYQVFHRANKLENTYVELIELINDYIKNPSLNNDEISKMTEFKEIFKSFLKTGLFYWKKDERQTLGYKPYVKYSFLNSSTDWTVLIYNLAYSTLGECSKLYIKIAIRALIKNDIKLINILKKANILCDSLKNLLISIKVDDNMSIDNQALIGTNQFFEYGIKWPLDYLDYEHNHSLCALHCFYQLFLSLSEQIKRKIPTINIYDKQDNVSKQVILYINTLGLVPLSKDFSKIGNIITIFNQIAQAYNDTKSPETTREDYTESDAKILFVMAKIFAGIAFDGDMQIEDGNIVLKRIKVPEVTPESTGDVSHLKSGKEENPETSHPKHKADRRKQNNTYLNPKIPPLHTN